MQRLVNSRSGFESNCFVCEAANPAGLGLELFAGHDENAIDAIGAAVEGVDADHVRGDRKARR